jgi:hypothetical protein
MSDWEQKPDLDEPPGKTDPRPSPSDSGWAEWVRKEANEAREKKYGPGTSKEYKISLTVERIGTVDFATEGTVPGPWETEPVTAKTQPPAEYKDFTRYRRKYPKIKIIRYEVYKVTLVIEFPQPDGGKLENTYHFWKSLGGTNFEGIWVYRWKQTSGIRVVNNIELEWYDGTPWSNDTVKPWYPFDEFISPPESPPEYLLSMSLKSSAEEQYVAWRPARPDALLASIGTPSISEAELVESLGSQG